MEIIVLFLLKPSLLAWSVAIPKVEMKLGLSANWGTFSVTAFTRGTPSLSLMRMQYNPFTLKYVKQS